MVRDEIVVQKTDVTGKKSADSAPGSKQGPLARMAFRGRELLEGVRELATSTKGMRGRPMAKLLLEEEQRRICKLARTNPSALDAVFKAVKDDGAVGIAAAEVLARLARKLDLCKAVWPLLAVLESDTAEQHVKAAQYALVMIALNPETQARTVGDIADRILLCKIGCRKARLAEVLVNLVERGNPSLVDLAYKELRRVNELPFTIDDMKQPPGSERRLLYDAFIAASMLVNDAIKAARESAKK